MEGIPYEKIEVGAKASFAKTISETDVYLFAGISGDFNPLHVNEEYARTTPFGTRIAHGTLAASLLATVLGMKLPGPGTLAIEVRQKFKKPVHFNDTITCMVEVITKVERLRVIDMRVVWTNQKGETVMRGGCRVRPPVSV